MRNFTLIAVRPLDGCQLRFLKNLKTDKPYIFHQAYQFHLNDNKMVEYITHDPVKDDDLYTIKRDNLADLKVKVSAIVGKNGSGKSSLFELIFLSAYIISNRQGILKENKEFLKETLDRESRKGVKDEKKIEWLTKNIKDQEMIFEDFAAELYLHDGNQIKQIKIERGVPMLKIYENTQNIFRPTPPVATPLIITNKDLGRYFYAIVINYSLYGLNALKSGKWLEALFHKNDGYQTPIVINPFREDGNILVNSELHLAQSRLMANLTDQTMTTRVVLDGKPVKSITFSLSHDQFETVEGFDFNASVIKQEEYDELDLESIFLETYFALLNEVFDLDKKSTIPFFNQITKYVFKKLLKISIKYYPEAKKHERFKKEVLIGEKMVPVEGVVIPNLSDLLDFLVEQNSHVTLKLKQILNSVRYNLLREDDDTKWQTNNTISIPITKLEERLKEAIKDVDQFDPLELMPGSFFHPSFVLGDGSKFHDLSSGEQHLVHTTQAVLYHLINLNTVFNRPNKLYYADVLLMLDEVELYFHPDFQKRIISDLLISIKQLNIPNIKTLNILLSTHSPFILSDIPRNHVMKLDKGEPLHATNETFGANIHNLLADSFFLGDGFMGVFAQKEIKEAIDYLQRKLEGTSGVEIEDGPDAKWNENTLGVLKELIGEPVLKRAFEELYYTVYITKLEEQIALLERIKRGN